MAHLVWDGLKWGRVEPEWVQSCTVKEYGVDPQKGDTFSDFTSHKSAAADIAKRGMQVVVLREAMWGEKDYRIV